MASKIKISKDTRKYKCPFCDHRDLRHELVAHVQDVHFDIIPESETAAKLVFDYVNKSREARCIVCKKLSVWDESKWRYKRVCSPECSKKFTSLMRTNHIKVHGVPTLLNDESHQIKMLNNRKISGAYKFQDGGIKTYVGSYEKERLEFLDIVMGFSSQDIVTPGPTIEYEYKGEKHKWITDCYIIPFNLVIDDKPGGSNKNTHSGMEEYNDKQLAKEDELVRIGKYNYIRLTDKNFSQLLEALMVIKHNMQFEPDGKPVVIINEGAILESSYENNYNGTSGLRLITINNEAIEKYSYECPELKMIDDIQNMIGVMAVDNETVIGFVCMDIQSREITYVYQHDAEKFIYGDLIDIATTWGADSIIIDKRNELVLDYHLTNGWNIEQENDIYCKMTKKDEVVQEGKVFTTKDIHLNLDKWYSNKNNILFVTGLSGSGKTTIAKDLSEKYNAVHIELDWIDNNNTLKDKTDLTEGEQLIKEYFEKTNGWFDYYEDEDDINYKAAYNYIMTKIRQDTRKKYVVEGVHIFMGLTDISKEDSLIIKCTSPTKSTLNAAKRRYNNDVKELILNTSLKSLANIVQGVKQRTITYDKIKAFTKSISEALIEEMNGSLPPAHPHIVAYSDNGIEINGFGITKNRLMDNTYIVNNNKIENVGHDYFKGKHYCLMRFHNIKDFEDKIEYLDNLSLSNKEVDTSFIMESIVGVKLASDDQVLYDNRFKQLYVSDKSDNTTYEERIERARIDFQEMTEIEGTISESAIELLSFPLTSESDIRCSNKLLESYNGLTIECDFNGYYVRNMRSGFRTKSVKAITDIQDDTISIASLL